MNRADRANDHRTGAGTPPRVFSAAAPAAAFFVIAICLALDLASDLWGDGRGTHVAGEFLGIALSLGCVATVWRLLNGSQARVRELALTLDRTRADLVKSRDLASRMLHEIGDHIDEQFDRLDLSPSERDVALLLLKGLSLQEVAGARDRSELAVRHQAEAVYRKADVTGQAELAAFLLETLLLPLGPLAATTPRSHQPPAPVRKRG